MRGILHQPSKLSKFTLDVIRNLPFNPHQLKRQLADTSGDKKSTSKGCNNNQRTSKTYNTPHPPKDPPENFKPTVIHKGFSGSAFMPYGVFRPFNDPNECLGPGAGKCDGYKNSEYYSYHRYSFVDIQRAAIKLRDENIRHGGARCVYDYETARDENSNEEPKTETNGTNQGKPDTTDCPNAIPKKPDNKETTT